MRIGVAGLGSAGSRHAFNLVSLGEDVALFDPDISRARDLAAKVSAQAGDSRCLVAESIDELWELPIGACVVASPTNSHAQLVLQGLQKKIPLFVEKPLTLSYEEGMSVAQKQAKTGTPLMVGYNLRFVEGIRDVKRRLEQGEIGNPLAAIFRFGYDLRSWRKGVDYKRTYSAYKKKGGGILLEASHEFDLAYWLLGPFESAFGVLRRTGFLDVDPEDLACVILNARSGAVASFFLEMISSEYRRSFEIVGDKGTLEWKWSPTSSPAEIDRSYKAELSQFLECLRSGVSPEPGISEGVYALGVVDAVSRSSAFGRPVSVPPPIDSSLVSGQ